MLLFSGVRTSSAETILGDYLAQKDIDVSVSASIDFYNKYIWRGFQLDSDPVIQPSLTVEALGFDGGIWSSFDVDQDDGEGLNSDEVDGWLGYSFDLGFIDESLGIVGVSVGHTWYDFPGADTYTTEWYFSIALDTFLSPYFTWYYDYGDEAQGGADGSVYAFGAGHSFTLSEDYGISLDLGAEVGINDEHFIAGEGGYFLGTVGLTIPLTEGVTMAPVMAWSSPFGDLEDTADGNQDDHFYAGVSMSFSM
ncbi:MAG: hypothetical protein KC713_00420 [Candidatus Omnitrophica bacterium]|nr:hypothetical protein [Candidatus Omnitrophota bacterium]